MDLVSRVIERTRGVQNSWPVGPGALLGFESEFGHDQSEFSPVEYGDYLATSNDVYSVVALRARMLSRLRLRFYRGNTSEKTELPDSPAAQLFSFVNPFWTSSRLARMDEMCMGVWGESFWAIERERGVPREIWWIKPSRMVPVPHESGYLQGFLYESVSGQRLAFRPDEIIWFRYPNPLDEFSPLSPLAAARLAADAASAMTRSNERMFANGLQLKGLIVPPDGKVTFTQDQADDLDRQLRKRFTGADNAGRWAVLRYEAQFRQLQMSAKDAEFIGGLNMSFRQVCRAYGIQSPLLNDLEHATLANAREFQKMAWEMTLGPDATFKADEVTEQFLPMFRGSGPDHCEYDFSQVAALQESQAEAWSREAQALDRGALTINEWRKSKGMPPVTWGDEPWLPLNKAQPDEAGMLPGPQDAAVPPDDETNPANRPPAPRDFVDHHTARALLAACTPSPNGSH